ncbi:MAG: hypothetical protein WCT85_07260 [Parachlamydiales bacterium]|jgi:hypothetical protein
MSISSPCFFSDFRRVAVYETQYVDAKPFVKKKIQLIDLNTQERYKNDPAYDAVAKITLVFLLNPIVMFSKMAFNVGQIGYDFTKSFFFSSLNMFDDFWHGRIIKIFEEYVVSKIILFEYLAEDIINIVKAPFFAVAIQFACLFAVISPNNAKKMIAKIEKGWNLGLDVKHDFRHMEEFKDRKLLSFIGNLFNKRNEISFYMAPCFQPIGMLSDKNIKVI